MAKETKKKNQIDMLHGPMLKKMLLFAIPIAATSILQQLFNIVDTMVVGRFAGKLALAAVGSTSSLMMLYINLFVGVSVGANVVIANYIGQKRPEHISGTVRTAMSTALVGGISMIFIGVFTARPALELMGAPDDVIDLATLYMRIYFCGTPFAMLYNFGASVLRSKGDTKRPLYCLAFSGAVNIGLNLLLVIVFDMSVAGVAIATVIANGINCVLTLYFLAHEEPEFRFRIRDFGFKKLYLVQVLKIGIPSGIQGMVFSISNVCVQSAINSFGSAAIAGSAAAVNFEFLSFFIVNAFVQTATTFTSQNYGARNITRCKKVFVRCLAMAFGFAAIADIGFFMGRPFFIRLFTTEMTVIPFAYMRLRHVLLFQPLVALYEVTGGCIRGTGRSLVPALISLFGTCALRIVWSVVTVKEGLSFTFLMDTYPASWVITTVLMFIAYAIVRKKAFKNV